MNSCNAHSSLSAPEINELGVQYTSMAKFSELFTIVMQIFPVVSHMVLYPSYSIVRVLCMVRQPDKYGHVVVCLLSICLCLSATSDVHEGT